MCLIIIAHRMSPDHPLVLAANRDEFFSRPTRQAHEWPDAAIIAGRDLRAGGTWLGVGRGGRFAAVTNIRESGGNGAGRRSRGELPLGFLLGDEAPGEYLAGRSAAFGDYAGFNLLVGDAESVCHASNRWPGIRELGRGIYGLSNGASDSNWPKVVRGKGKMAEVFSGDAAIDADALIARMRDEQQAGEAELPDTGIPDVQEKRLSSMFIPAGEGNYGTRCISVFIRRGDGACEFTERNFAANGECIGRHDFAFSLPQPPQMIQFTRCDRSSRSTPAS